MLLDKHFFHGENVSAADDVLQKDFYNSSSEVVRESLRLLMDRDQQKQILLTELKSELRLGLRQIDSIF